MDKAERAAYAQGMVRHLQLPQQYEANRQALDKLNITAFGSDHPLPPYREVEEAISAPQVLFALSRLPTAMPRPRLVMAPVLRETKDRVLRRPRRRYEDETIPVSPQRLAAAFNDPEGDLLEPNVFVDDSVWNKYAPADLNADSFGQNWRNRTAGIEWTARLLFRDTVSPNFPPTPLRVPGLVYAGQSRARKREAFNAECEYFGDALSLATIADVVVLHALERLAAQNGRDPRAVRRPDAGPEPLLLKDSTTSLIQCEAHRVKGRGRKLWQPAVVVEDDTIRLSSTEPTADGDGGMRRGIRVIPRT